MFNARYLSEKTESQNRVRLTVKNYGAPNGVATALNNNMTYEVKGPMGKGLMVKPEGVHVAFAAGTGVLVFVDLVAMLAMVNLEVAEKIVTQDQLIVAEKFKLVLYVSFPSRSESVALELFEALSEYCQRNSIINFELIVRLSKEKINPKRWN